MKNKIIWKEVGETPLAALERFRSEHAELAGVPMTYAGRLDPMASGVLLVLIGEECKKKDEYLNLDKIYEVEVCFGVETDTYDGLGLIGKVYDINGDAFIRVQKAISDLVARGRFMFTQEYPPFSSRAVGGRQMHELARAGELPEDVPSKEVTIYSVECLEGDLVDSNLVVQKVLRNISKVKGDFRQEDITSKWTEALNKPPTKFFVAKLKVQCSSGTYMRSLAHRLGREAKTGAFASSITRLEIISKK